MEEKTAMEAIRQRMGMSVEEFYAIPRKPPSESKLPIYDASHVRNAMARFNQITGVSSEERAHARRKIIARAKKFGIDTSGFEAATAGKAEPNYYQTKDICDGAIKDVDTVTGTVTGYFSIFGNKDSDGDIVMPGAFKRSLNANGPSSEKPRILHLYMHDTQKPLSKPNVLKEDKTGLYFESHISHTSLGKDVIQLYQDKVLTEHSIGYQVVKREVDDSDKERVQKLTELKLWEGSTVSWGANADALVTSVKDGQPNKKTWNKFLSMMNSLDEALRGNYSDDTARQLEIQFKQFQQVVMTLADTMDPIDVTPEPDNSKQLTAEWVIERITKNIHL